MKAKTSIILRQPVEDFIRFIRGQRVILDANLARIYGVTTKQLIQAVKRNADRFLDDFAFPIERQEVVILRSQIVTSRSHGGRRYRPVAFTEHGAIMAANVLRSPRAIQMSVFVVRAFLKMREVLAQNKELATKLAELESKLTSRLDDHEKAISSILDEIRKLMEPALEPEPRRRPIGFHVHDAP